MYVRINPGHQVTYNGAVFTAGQSLRNVPAALAQVWINDGIATAYNPPRTRENTFRGW
ncbi:hypothetical protein OG911_16615 [Streptomyces sp. NBC_00208]|uniref:hypothetical protein n=1 Tax=Streptomyces sp. NBC_00208 TaxID=2975681 RepID=UPI002E28AC20|nr:hypothetical protein [Streptomyces sp. NBC_00208]